MDLGSIVLGVLVFILGLFGSVVEVDNSDLNNVDTNNVISQDFINIPIKTIYNLNETINSDFEVRFCPQDGCEGFLSETINQTKNEIKCAFYELDNLKVINTFQDLAENNISIELIIDDRYLDEENFQVLKNIENIQIYSDVDRGTRYNNYMHDKFCVIDNETVITGSTNPTENGLLKNNNNMEKYESRFLAQNYYNEFEQMKNNFFGTNKISKLKYNNITLNYGNESYFVQTYFCPQDDCLNPVLNELENANSEILFASFAFTSDDITSILKMKNYQGINISGVIETRSQNLKGSDYKELKEEFPFVLDTNKNTMHHKFFVIDNETVITGSMNPTRSGLNYNDENLLIIRNPQIASMFREEFFSLVN